MKMKTTRYLIERLKLCFKWICRKARIDNKMEETIVEIPARWEWDTCLNPMNPNVAQINFSVDISRSFLQEFYLPLGSNSQRYLEKLGQTGSKIVSILDSEVSGLTEIMISKYEITLTKAKLFKWEQIVRDVDKCLSNVFLLK